MEIMWKKMTLKGSMMTMADRGGNGNHTLPTLFSTPQRGRARVGGVVLFIC
jgi:hypothetical protein